MDATTLRIVLFVAGLIFIAGIYLYETRRRKRESAQARRRVPPKVEHAISIEETEPPGQASYENEAEAESTLGEFTAERPIPGSDAFDEAPGEFDSFTIGDEPIPGIDSPGAGIAPGFSANGEEPPATARPNSMEQQELFGFSAQEESPVDVPDLIIQINVKARKAPFDGPAIVKAMQETGMHLSHPAIYQRLASDGSKKVLYNLASMVEPGVFPKSMADFSTPGLTLFTQLPGPGDGMMIFSDMLYTAERLAATLLGDLQDDTHSVLSKQTIEHLREQIMEHKRQIQLARRKG